MTFQNSKRGTKAYSIGEEIFNAITHGLGTLLSIAGLVCMLIISVQQNSVLKITCSIVFGAALIILYCASTLYHALTTPQGKKVFQILDHCSIFLLIAGTYTPFTLIALKGALGWGMFIGIWTAAIVGIILNAVNLQYFKKISMWLYIIMGWCVIITVYPLLKTIAWQGVFLLLLGGASYSLGVIFYKQKQKMYFHGIWHIFVLIGSILHFFAILLYVL